MEKRPVHGLVVDDHKSVCDGIAALVEKTGLFDQVYTAFSAQQALELLKTKWIHLAMIDARMPVMSGLELIKLVYKQFPSMKVICITSFDEEDTLKEIWSLNVNGILMKKSTDAAEIRDCLQRVLNGDQYFANEIKEMIDGFNSAGYKTLLTAREREVLSCICLGQSTKEIAVHFDLSPNTVEDYRKSMIKKAKVKNTPELVAYAHRNGLV